MEETKQVYTKTDVAKMFGKGLAMNAIYGALVSAGGYVLLVAAGLVTYEVKKLNENRLAKKIENETL